MCATLYATVDKGLGLGLNEKNIIYGMYHVDDGPSRIRYVGQTILGMKRRFRLHTQAARENKPYPVSRWIRKHGEDNIGVSILHATDDPSELNGLEIEEIARLRGVGQADLNVTDGGGGTLGWAMREETKEKIRKKATGRAHSDETKEKLRKYRGDRASFWGKHHTNDMKRKSALSHKNRKLDEESARELRRRYDAGERPIDLAAEFNVTPALVCMVGKRKAWSWVE